jgi:hypothetical protein
MPGNISSCRSSTAHGRGSSSCSSSVIYASESQHGADGRSSRGTLEDTKQKQFHVRHFIQHVSDAHSSSGATFFC